MSTAILSIDALFLLLVIYFACAIRYHNNKGTEKYHHDAHIQEPLINEPQTGSTNAFDGEAYERKLLAEQ